MHAVVIQGTSFCERPAASRGESASAAICGIGHFSLLKDRILVGETERPEQVEEISGVFARDAQFFRTITVEQSLFFFRERAVQFKPFFAVDRTRFHKLLAKISPREHTSEL